MASYNLILTCTCSYVILKPVLVSLRKMTNDKITFIMARHIAKEVPRIEKLRRLKLEMNDIRMKDLGFKTMATSLLPSNKKRKTKNTKATTKLMDLGDDDLDYQPAEDEDTLSSHSNDEEEVISNHIIKLRLINNLVIFISHHFFFFRLHLCIQGKG